ncbi:ATP-binding cassette (ABC) transporter [Komagataella phaffii CBS 7435]|uniref:Plasma membrane ATP-binding cassette (ABC) transporter n=2 Tax=Komagataella phaffii TaxID=460519 RepID=C4R737_KOMPG|nr:Plasma membrane ATP-binding cassette (ABC) transporter [Komagataella phaffii GS115]AOA64756.1 GQ67_04502T0 [Komagataella phaffii]CAH2451218.1 ATP-binding cassette (ABC) transporter [Komagataella phaffii CBS 7435]AOA69850.1 GQ68_04474T0 [Komagataella phaffii GS115]CAY71412.1 Plasma membrane ATP-binding cassette (ABC) transporter [Komagataella phaffii GS115]CCA40977.1 ATP-binding cassette (ABC) transporter [Komagataella phaffii CBS 7435]
MSSLNSSSKEDDSASLEKQILPEMARQKRLFSFLLPSTIPPLPTDQERKPYPAGVQFSDIPYHQWVPAFISRIFFWWVVPLLKTGYVRTIFPNDLYYLERSLKVEALADKFKKVYQKEVDKRASPNEPMKLTTFMKPLFKTIGVYYFYAIGFKIIFDCGTTLAPLLTKELIKYVSLKSVGVEPGIGKGVGYALGASFLIIVPGICLNHSLYYSTLCGQVLYSVLNKMVLEKSFRLDGVAEHNYPIAKINSMLGTDLSRLELAFTFSPFMMTIPVTMAIAITLLIINIGVSALAGLGMFFLCLVIVFSAIPLIIKIRIKIMGSTDKRVSHIKELANYLKFVKFYSWENSYFSSLTNARTTEMKYTFRMHAIRNSLTALAVSTPALSSMLAFVVAHAVSRDRTPAEIFSSLSLFNVLSMIVFLLPMCLFLSADALLGLKRVCNFLQAPEAHLYDEQETLKTDVALQAKNGTFYWETFENEDDTVAIDHKTTENNKAFSRLKNINLEVKKGEFLVITGLIGTGKSSLLAALSGQMKRESGSVSHQGSLLLCGEPWIQNTTIRENIVFGQPFDETKYWEVIKCCALTQDLDMLDHGDITEVGERGITLSGGQKARINLARAVYNDRDILLMDDVLSAVDARVGKHIMDNCIMGLLHDKTRILATHQLSLISTADRICFLNGDGTIDVGTFEELSARNQNFTNLMVFNSESSESKDEEKELKLIKSTTLTIEEKLPRFHDINDGKLMKKEQRAINGIPIDVYKTYISMGSGVFGKLFSPMFILVVAVTTFCQLFTNVWLSFWTSNRFSHLSEGIYIGIYIMFTFLSMITVTTEYTLIAYLTNKASTKLNIAAMKRFLHVPMSYLDTTPIGQIINRFTKDTDTLDNEIGEQFRMVVYPSANVIGVLIMCIAYLPWFAIALPFLFLLFLLICSFYQATAREVKRIESIQRSFVFSHVNEVLNGMHTIKSYQREDSFISKNDLLLNNMNEASFITNVAQRWLAVILDTIGAGFAFLITMLCVTRQFDIGPSSVGLLVTYLFQIVGQMSLLIRSITQLENNMNSVERLYEYSYNLPQEASYDSPSRPSPPSTWPENGVIDFKDVSLRYRPGLPLVLKNINIHIPSRFRVGICGRTGAGKSSIMTALYRINELAGGQIVIDDVDISTLNLYDLRSNLSIIPQDPVLFKGTIRKNLDPFGEKEDDVLWAALLKSGIVESSSELEQVKLQKKKGQEELHKFHLDQVVEDEGSNFSLGERQLIALARAIVRDSKILILDEATSSVDYKTDAKIQSAIVREFNKCSILCIAHRLKTIVNYDRILVLEAGQVAEFDTPWRLYHKSSGIFRAMCEKANIMEHDFDNRS